jgi:hypothetical protein
MPAQWGDKLEETYMPFKYQDNLLSVQFFKYEKLILLYMLMHIIRTMKNLGKAGNLIHIEPRK